MKKIVLFVFLTFIIPLITFAQEDIDGADLTTKDVVAVNDGETAKTIVLDLQAAGYMAMIDQMVDRIKNSSDEKTIQSCEEIIKYAISELKQLPYSSLDAKYVQMIQTILSYYLKGMQYLIDNFHDYWSVMVKFISGDISSWLHNQQIQLVFCNQMTLFGILMFLPNAKEQNIDDIAANIMTNLSPLAIDDFVAFMILNLTVRSCDIKKDIMTDIVNSLYSAKNRYDKKSSFYRFLETLKTFSENINPTNDWPYNQYDPTSIVRFATEDWHQIVSLF